MVKAAWKSYQDCKCLNYGNLPDCTVIFLGDILYDLQYHLLHNTVALYADLDNSLWGLCLQ